MATLGLWWWIDRWRKSTAFTDMTLEEQGAYRNLLDEATLRGGALPNDERILAKACGDATRWKRVREAVLARFPLDPDGNRRNATLDEVLYQGERRRRNQQSYRDRKGTNLSGNASDNAADNGRAHAVVHVATNKATHKAAYPDPDQDPEQEQDQQQPSGSSRATARPPTPSALAVPVPSDFLRERLAYGTADELLAWCDATRDAFAGHPVDRSRPWDFWKARWSEATGEPSAHDRASFDQWRRAMGPNASGVSIDDYLAKRRAALSSGPTAPRFAHFVTTKDHTA